MEHTTLEPSEGIVVLEKFHPPNITPSQYNTLPNSLDDFRKDDGGKCIRELFILPRKTHKLLNHASSLVKVASSDAKLGAETSSTVSGCLLVNWNKKKSESTSKMEGNFRFVWSVSRDNIGFAVYLSGKNVEEDAMEFEGVAYVFEKSSDKWEAKRKLDLESTKKKLTKDELKEKFPKLGKGYQDDSTRSGDDGDYWGFLDKEGKIKDDEENRGVRTGSWSGHSSTVRTSVKLQEWSSNLDTWWKHFFDNSAWNMVDVIKEISGYWT